MSTVTINLDDRHYAALDAIAKEQYLSKTAVMRQALRLYQVIHERAKQGQQLTFITKDGKLVPLLVPSMLPLNLESAR